MKQNPFPILLLLLSLILAGCRAAAVEASSGGESGTWPSFRTDSLLDEQGAVTVSVEPLNLNEPGDTLDFQVGMNTHSVTLSMDLTDLATLTTDTGRSVKAISWDAPRGGHHVSGVLSFPVSGDDGTLLDGATSITLIIRDVDAPERAFTWNLEG